MSPLFAGISGVRSATWTGRRALEVLAGRRLPGGTAIGRDRDVAPVVPALDVETRSEGQYWKPARGREVNFRASGGYRCHPSAFPQNIAPLPGGRLGGQHRDGRTAIEVYVFAPGRASLAQPVVGAERRRRSVDRASTAGSALLMRGGRAGTVDFQMGRRRVQDVGGRPLWRKHRETRSVWPIAARNSSRCRRPVALCIGRGRRVTDRRRRPAR